MITKLRLWTTTLLVTVPALFVGCGGEETAPQKTDSAKVAPDSAAKSDAAPKRKRTLQPIVVGDQTPPESGKQEQTVDAASSVIDRLKPLQVLLGSWRGTTRREFDGFKAVAQQEWVWDLQTDSDQPALVLSTEGKSPYMVRARLTWRTTDEEYRLSVSDSDGAERTFAGRFQKEIEDVVGDDGKLQRTFLLVFEQIEPADASEQFQLAFNQQENNRWLLEVSKKRGRATFRRIDTVSTQREGTSFALSDSDYGDKTCIISQGLGTISINYKGRTYWVCCTGCKAAFEDDPERWIALAAEKAKEAR